MGTSLRNWTWLHEFSAHERVLFSGAHIVEMGPQGIFIPREDSSADRALSEFMTHYNPALAHHPEELNLRVRQVVANACMGPGIRTSYVAEFLVPAGFRYTSVDIYATGVPETNVFVMDLNTDTVPIPLQQSADLVTNFGTSEHIFNQLNCFKVMHDFTKPGGVMWHQIPSTGYVDHGYFAYNPQFFRHIVESNGYEVLHFEFIEQGGEYYKDMVHAYPAKRPIFSDGRYLLDHKSPNTLISIMYRRSSDAPFKIGLEVATAGGPVDERVLRRYPLSFV